MFIIICPLSFLLFGCLGRLCFLWLFTICISFPFYFESLSLKLKLSFVCIPISTFIWHWPTYKHYWFLMLHHWNVHYFLILQAYFSNCMWPLHTNLLLCFRNYIIIILTNCTIVLAFLTSMWLWRWPTDLPTFFFVFFKEYVNLNFACLFQIK